MYAISKIIKHHQTWINMEFPPFPTNTWSFTAKTKVWSQNPPNSLKSLLLPARLFPAPLPDFALCLESGNNNPSLGYFHHGPI